MEEKTKEIEVAVAEVVDYLRVTGQFHPALRAVVERKLTAQEAKNKGIGVTEDELQQAADAFRVMHDLNKAKDTEDWLSSSGVTVETFEEFLETNLLMNKLKDELGKQADKEKYISSEGVQESMREMIYQDWLGNQFK